jgi:hypothetical protein
VPAAIASRNAAVTASRQAKTELGNPTRDSYTRRALAVVTRVAVSRLSILR